MDVCPLDYESSGPCLHRVQRLNYSDGPGVLLNQENIAEFTSHAHQVSPSTGTLEFLYHDASLANPVSYALLAWLW